MMTLGAYNYDHNTDLWTVVMRLLPRILKFAVGILLLLLNQRWIFLVEADCSYCPFFAWHYLSGFPQLMGYAASMTINLTAATLVVQAMFAVSGKHCSKDKRD